VEVVVGSPEGRIKVGSQGFLKSPSRFWRARSNYRDNDEADKLAELQATAARQLAGRIRSIR